MSLCDRCFHPGSCCQYLALNVAAWAETAEEANAELATIQEAEDVGVRETNLPFRATVKDADGFWRWSCSALQPDGRCGIYEERPHVCRKFEPGSDRLCVHFGGAEAGDPTAP